MDSLDDVIVAPITGVTPAGVALIRGSGAGSWRLAEAVFRAAGNSRLKPRHAVLGVIHNDGEVIDEGYLVLFESGKSYTTEESFELSCHGNPAIVRRIVNLLIEKGARAARPGEFTERAFLNGRIDLTQAEAVRDTIEAATEAQQRRARLLRDGRLARHAAEIRRKIAHELATVEAVTDFSEEIGDLDREASCERISSIVAEIRELVANASSAHIMRHGLRIAIVGRPNVGKSSLMNRMLGSDRAIVTEIPGTTRDTIEEAVEVRGLPVVLIDTAGIRQTEDRVEAIGVERSQLAAAHADTVWMVVEAPSGWTSEDEALAAALGREPDLIVANKADLGKQESRGILVSALTGEGFDQLEAAVQDCFGVELPLANERQSERLAAAADRLEAARATLEEGMPTDLACVDLYGALHEVGAVTGDSATDDILEQIFRDFCIGK